MKKLVVSILLMVMIASNVVFANESENGYTFADYEYDFYWSVENGLDWGYNCQREVGEPCEYPTMKAYENVIMSGRCRPQAFLENYENIELVGVDHS